MVATGRAACRLTNDVGDALAGARVRAFLPTDWPGFSNESRGTTDGDGRVVLEDLVPGFAYTIRAAPASALPVEAGPHAAASGETVEVDLRTAPCRWIDVLVIRESDGAPLPRAWVSAAAVSGFGFLKEKDKDDIL